MNEREQKLKSLGLSFVDPTGKIIGDMGQQNNLSPFIVGGIIRDSLLGRPSKDIDICVASDPESLQRAAAQIDKAIPSGSKLRNKYELIIRQSGISGNFSEFLKNAGGGVLLAFLLFLNGKTDYPPVVYPRFLVAATSIGGEPVELVATRSEDYSTTEGTGSRNRNPGSITIADEKEDAFRRDFTINALYVNLSTGQLSDPTSMGLSDLKKKIIRTTGDPISIFNDDPLRILRAIRQSAQLGFQIDPKTQDAMDALIKEKGQEFFGPHGSVSAERIRDEFSKILLSTNAAAGLDEMFSSGVLDVIAPEISAVAADQLSQHKDIWGHTKIVMENAIITPEIDVAIRETAPKVEMSYEDLRTKILLRIKLSALLHDTGKIEARSYGDTLCPFCQQQTVINNAFTPVCQKCGQNLSNFRIRPPTFHQHEFSSEKMAWDLLNRLQFDNQMIRWVARDCGLHQLQFDDYVADQIKDTSSFHMQPKITLVEKLVNKLSDAKPGHEDPWASLNFAVRLYGLIRADSSANPAAQQRRVNDFIQNYEIARTQREEQKAWQEFNRPLLTGDEIMQHFGIRPGKWIGDIHNRLIQDRQENPMGHNKERALEIAQEELSKWGPEIYKK
jgi:poly(A) polymerase